MSASRRTCSPSIANIASSASKISIQNIAASNAIPSSMPEKQVKMNKLDHGLEDEDY